MTEVLGHPFYQLWYVGVGSEEDFGDYGLGMAVSSNGTDFEPYPGNPLLEEADPGAWNADNMDALQVVWDHRRGAYVLLYQGYNLDPAMNTWGLGMAWSVDGTTWNRGSEQAPVFDLNERVGDVQGWCWPLGLTLAGETGTGYTGYMAGFTARGTCDVYRLNASDEVTWTPDTTPVLTAGGDGEWDDEGVLSVAVATLDGTRYMFYVGFGDWTVYDGYQSSKDQFLGWAVFQGDRWVKGPDLLPLHTTEEGLVGGVAAHTVGSRIHLWITDDYDGTSAVGYFLFDPERASGDGEGR